MKKFLVLLLIVIFFSCEKNVDNSITIFEKNHQEFIELKKTVLANFIKIKASNSCYKNKKTIHITLKYFENCFSNLDKEVFDKVYSFILKYSIESISIEEEKLTLLIKVDSNIFNTEKRSIVFSKKKIIELNTVNSSIKELKKGWYYLLEKETTF